MISLLKIFPDKWEQARGYLRLDLEAIEAAMNQRWSVTFGANNLLQPDTIAGDYSTDSRYVSNQGTDNMPLWDQVNLSDGVKNRLPYSNFVAATAGSRLVGRGSASGGGDFEEISLGSGLMMQGTVLSTNPSGFPVPEEFRSSYDPWPKGTNAGSLIQTTFTPGSVIFAGTSGILSQDNSGLYFDSTNDRLGVGVASPSDAVDVRATTPIIGARFSAATGFASLRFYEVSTLVSTVQAIGSNFSSSDRRNNLELFNATATGNIAFHVNNASTATMVYSSAGVLGVGIITSFLANRLHVVGTVTSTDVAFFSASSATTNLATDFGQLALDNSSTTDNSYTSLFFTSRHLNATLLYGAAIQSQTTSHTNGAGTATLIFKTRNSGTLAERGRFDSTGLVIPSSHTITLTGVTASRVLFAGTSGVISNDSAFVWDSTNDYLGIGITPAGTLDVSGTYTADQAFGFRQQATHNTATAGTVYGGQFNATITHSSGTMNSAVGLTNAARFGATSNATNLTGEQCFIALTGASPSGTITTAQSLNLSQISNFATGTPAVTISQARGMIIGNIGAGNGSNGLTVSNSCAMSIAGSQSSNGGNSAVMNISDTTSVPFAPTGDWSIYNASTRKNHFAGPIFMGGTTAPGSGTNFIQFSNGTEVGTTAADTSAIYTADVVAGDSNLFATNEQDVVNQLTGLHVRKTADEAIANNTYQDDNHLTINLKASSSYEFEFYGFFTQAATAGIKVQIDGTAGVSTLLGNAHIYDATGVLIAFQRFTAFNTSTGVDTANGYFTIKGVIEVSTAGTLRLEWAQNTTDAGNSTTVLEDSFLVIRKLNA